ncbi:hypothetical protein RKD33_004219 [Streptomyces sp. SAI-129]
MGPAHPWHCRGCGPLSPVGRSGGGSTGRPRSCVDEGERIMNGGAATAFLPNFVAFPSLRGLHSSTVQPGRTPRPHGVRRGVGAPTGSVPRWALWVGRGAGPRNGPRGRGCGSPWPELSCPVSAASAASAAAPSPAGRPASAGRAATTGVARVAVRGRTAPVTGPPAVAAAAVAPAAAPARPPAAPGPHGTRGASAPHENPDQQGCEHEQDDACDHGSTLPSVPDSRPEVPRSNPPSDASLRIDGPWFTP